MSKRGSNEGSIYKRASDGRWVGAVSDNGQRKVIYGLTRGAVAERMKALLAAQQKGTRITTRDRLSVGAFLTTWIVGMRANVRMSTWLRYSELVRTHLVPRIGRIPLTRLEPKDLSEMYATMLVDGFAPRTAGHAHRVLGRALRDAEVGGLIHRNAARLVSPPRVPRKEMQTLTGEQVRVLIEAAKTNRLGALFVVAVASGARMGELSALCWRDVDLTRGAIRITATLTETEHGYVVGETKTASSRRTISVGSTATAALKAHRIGQAEERLRYGLGKASAEDFVFSDPLGRPVQHASRLLTSLLERAGLPRVRAHDLRHTCATLLLEAGAHPRIVAERLGHSTPALVMNTYGHVTERMQEQATAAIDRVLGA
jgi:integrase